MKKMWLWLLYSFVACLALVVVLELLSPHLPTIDRLIYNLTMLAVPVLIIVWMFGSTDKKD